MSAAIVAPFAAAADLTGLSGFVVDVVRLAGAPGLGLLVAIENLFPPVPSEVVLPLGGFLAGRGELGLVPVLVWSTAGSLLGALALYGLGATLGEARLGRALARVPLVEEDDVHRAVAWFARHGERAVLVGRLVPVVRSLVSVPAGAQRMSLGRFCAYTVLGSGSWNCLLVGAGFLLGERWTTVGRYTRWLDALLVAAVVVVLVRFVRRRRGGSDRAA